jgi:2-(1,2-epoxy-1,2-dihydrophenyl)acetyl-CoA isomerase
MPDTDILIKQMVDSVFTIRLNRPKVNALDFELIAALQSAFKQAADDPSVRVVLLAGSGGIFSAGQDITVFQQVENPSYRYHLLRTYNPLVLQIRRLDKPVIAVIQGFVSGAALGLALACDLRIASQDARFIVGFSGIGLAPDSAVSVLLPLLIGLGRAAEYTYNNAAITAEQALDWGLVNRVAPTSQLDLQAAAWAAELARGPVHAMGLAKRAFNKALLNDLEQVLDYEAHLQEIAGHRHEHQEGVEAFLAKRAPVFTQEK